MSETINIASGAAIKYTNNPNSDNDPILSKFTQAQSRLVFIDKADAIGKEIREIFDLPRSDGVRITFTDNSNMILVPRHNRDPRYNEGMRAVFDPGLDLLQEAGFLSVDEMWAAKRKEELEKGIG